MNPEIKYFQRKLKEYQNKQAVAQRMLDNELETILAQEDIHDIKFQLYLEHATKYIDILKEIIKVQDHLDKLRNDYPFPLNVAPVFDALSFGYRVCTSLN